MFAVPCLPGTACVPSELTHFARWSTPSKCAKCEWYIQRRQLCMLHTELLQICANFSLTFPKVRLHCPLSAPRQVGAQFAIMPITRHHTVKSFAFTFYQLCAKLCRILYKVFLGKAMFQAPKKDCMQDKDEICE